jgi:hypothetical protein
MKIYELPDRELKITTIKMFNELHRETMYKKMKISIEIETVKRN